MNNQQFSQEQPPSQVQNSSDQHPVPRIVNPYASPFYEEQPKSSYHPPEPRFLDQHPFQIPGNGWALVGFVLGPLNIVFSIFIFPIGFVTICIGVLISCLGWKSKFTGLAVAGIVLSLFAGIMNLCLMCGLFMLFN